MSESKPGPGESPRRKPYTKPAFKKLTPEEAKSVLENHPVQGDRSMETLVDEVTRLLERD